MIEKAWSAEKVMEHIVSLGLWHGPARIEPLVGGLTNLNFTVRDNKGVYVVRVSFDMPAHDVYQSHVATAMIAAANAGISPRLYLVDGPLAVMDFLPGGALRSESFADNAVAEAAADLLRRLHGLGSSLPGPVRFNYPFQKVRRYYAFLKDAGTGKATAAVPEFESLCAGIEAQVPPFIPTFVHMDLLPQNFVYDADGALKLIDWDHGGIGHPLADLASMTVNGDILRPRWQALLSRYLGRTAHREDMKLFSLFCVVVSLMEYLWAPVQELVSHLPGDAVTASMASTYGAYAPTYEGYSELNLDRFRTVLDEHRRIFGPIEAAA